MGTAVFLDVARARSLRDAQANGLSLPPIIIISCYLAYSLLNNRPFNMEKIISILASFPICSSRQSAGAYVAFIRY